MRDLVLLVADQEIENVLSGLLARLPGILNIPQIDFKIIRYTDHDSGCAKTSDEWLRPYCNQFEQALVVFDRDGCGMETLTREAIESKVASDLQKNGWTQGTIAAIVIDPEIENWIWIDTPKVADTLHWRDEQGLYDWLRKNAWLHENEHKPRRPKEALQAVLRRNKKPRSASIYSDIAKSVSFKNCKDPAFLKMMHYLKIWFTPADSCIR